MEQTRRLANAVGLAMKAGKLQSGDFAVEKLVRAGKAKLVLLDCDTAQNTRQKYERLCQNMQVACMEVSRLGECIGKSGRMVAAVNDTNFCNMIRAASLADAPEGQE